MASANPTGGSVVAGAATIGGGGSSLLVTQSSNRAIINWNDFSIGSGQTTTFLQPSSTAAILNRVIGSNPSSLLGSLNANGQVFLINPNGVVVGQGATINAGSFAASTLDIPNASFMAGGDLTFSGSSTAAVANLGNISADTGDVYLIAQQVTNAGRISARKGTVGLAAGTEVTLTTDGTESVLVNAPDSAGGSGAAVLNSGTIKAAQAELTAAGGNLYALAINNTGVIRAASVQKVGGHIFLTADGDVSDSGTLDASASGANAAGGQVVVTGSSVNVAGSAVIAANGGTNGGTILIGGDIHGGSVPSEDLSTTPVANSQETTVAQGAAISANGGQGGGAGVGGSVVVWSDQQTNFQGSISALGGAAGGNGGFAEVSSHQVLNFAGAVDLLAPRGQVGTLLLDPSDVTISSSSTTNDAYAGGVYTPSAGASTSNILNTDLETELAANVQIVTTSSGSGPNGGSITVSAPVSWSTSTSLTLTAATFIDVNASITQTGTSSGGNITLTTGAGSSISIAGSTTISTASQGATITLQADGISVGSGTTVKSTGTGGEVYLEPVTASTGIDIGFSNPGYYQLTSAELNDITATTLVIGSPADTSAPLIVDQNSHMDAASGDSLENVTNLVLNGGSGGIEVAEPISLTGGDLVLDTTGGFAQGAVGGRGGAFAITASGLDLLGTNESYNLSATNAVSTLAASVGNGTVSLSNGSTALEIGTVSGTGGVTAGTLNITDTGSVDNATGNGGAAIAVTNLDLLGSAGVYTLTNSGNEVSTLAGSTGSVSLTDSSALTINTVNGTNGLTTTASGGITLKDSNASGVTLNSTNGALSAAAGGIKIKTDAISINDTITASSQTVSIEPNTTTDAMGLGSGSGTLQLSQAGIDEITAGTLQFGGSSQTGTLTVGGNVTMPSSISNVFMETAGQINIASGNSITNTNAGGNTVLVTNTTPVLGAAGAVSTGSNTGGTVIVEPLTPTTTLGLGTGAGTLQLSQASINDITAGTLQFGGATATGALTVGGNVTTTSSAITNLTLETGGLISVPSGSSVTDGSSVGVLTLQTDTTPSLGGLAAVSADSSTAGTVIVEPLTPSDTLGLGTATGTLELSQATIDDITAGTLQYGSASQTGSLTSGGTVAVPSTITNMTLATQGQITINSGTVSDTNTGAVLTLQSNLDPALAPGSVSVGASGTVVVTPATLSYGVDIGGSSAGYLQLTSDTLNDISATNLQIGSTADTTNPVIVDTNASLDANPGDSLQNVTNLALLGGTGGITINYPITMPNNGALTLNTTGTFLQASGGAITTTGSGGLLLVGAAEPFNLTNATNSVTALAASTYTLAGSDYVDLNNGSTSLSIGTVNGTSGVTSTRLTLEDAGEVTQTEPIAANLELTDIGTGAYVLTNPHNSVGSLAAATGSLNLTDSIPLTITTTGSTTNISVQNNEGPDGSAAITLTDSAPGGITTVSGVGVLNANGSSQSIVLTADSITLGAEAFAGNTMTLEPYTNSVGVDIGGTQSGYLQLSENSLNEINAPTLVIGNASDITNPIIVDTDADLNDDAALYNVLNLTLIGGSGGISINTPIELAGGEVLTLNSTGVVTQASNATLSGDMGYAPGSGPLLSLILLGSGGTFDLNSAPNQVNSLAASVGTGSVNLLNYQTPLSIDAITGPDGNTTTGVTAGTLAITTDSLGGVTQTAPITATNADFEGSGGVYSLDSGQVNAISVLAGSVGPGTIALDNDGTDLSIGTVNRDSGVTAATLTISDAGKAVTQTEPIAANLELLGAGTTYTLNSSSNAVSTLAGNTGTVSLTDGSALTVNTTGGTSGLAATGPITLIADSINLTAATGLINDSGQTVTLQPLTGGTAITLGGTAAGFDLPAAQLTYVTASSLLIGSDGTFGNASGAISITAAINPANVTNLGLLSGSTVSQTSGSTITATNLKVSGTTETLTEANSVGTVAMEGSGDISFYNNPSLTVGTVLGLYGVTSSGGTVLVDTSNSLTLASGSGATAAGVGSGDAVQMVDGATFTNNEGSSALSVTSGGGWWLIWSVTPLNDTLDSLAKGFKQYDATYGTTTPADLTANGVLYTIAPVVTPGLTGLVQKQYDTTTAATLVAGNYTSTVGAIDGDIVTLNDPTSGNYDTPEVGTSKTITVTGISVVSASNGDPIPVYGYQTISTASGPIGTITQAPLTISGLAATNKVYDTTESDTLTGTPTLTGVFASDLSNVVLNGNATSGTFASADVANNIVVTANLSSLSLTGSKALDYDITGVTTGLTADITQAPLTISGLAATNKVYDTTESDTLTGTPTLTGVYVADSSNVVLNGNATSGTFASPDVANNIVVTANLSGLSLTGSKALDYDITGVTTGLTADITQAPLTISGLAATNKVYDTTESDTLTGTPTLAGVYASDSSNVVLSGNATSGTFASPDVANNIVVTASLSGLSLTGSKALDYDITGVTTGLTADITQAPLTISGLAGTNKEYDTTESDTLTGTPTLTGVYVADSSNVVLNGNATSGTFASADVANNIVVTANLSGLSLTGSKALDYDITGVTTGLTADITQAPLTISGLSAQNKIYDTTEAATLTGTATLAGVFTPDLSNVSLLGSATSGTFASADVANNIVVTANLSGLSLTGSKALDYDITGVTTGLTADITQAPLTISGLAATNKVYDTTESDTLTGTPTLTGVYVADSSNVVLNGNATSGTFASPDVANNIVVTANLSGLSLTGSKALDYDITGVTTGLTADITQAPLTISGLAATNKVYDTTESDTLTGTPTLAGVYASDSSNVVLSGNATSGTFASPDVANNIVVTASLSGLSLTGSKALDYDITGVTTGLTADITQAPLTISGLAATNKVYDTTESDTLTGTPTLTGVYVADSSNVVLNGNATSGTFASADVANNIVVTANLSGLSLTGSKALDYDITGVTTGLTADITQAPLTISGLAATNKVYDTTESDTLTGTPTLTGVYVADSSNVVLNGNATSGTFASADVANNIVVTANLSGLSLTGTKALDYDITGVTTGLTADITQAPLTISGLSAQNKIYDTTEAATLTGTATLAGVFTPDLSNVSLLGSATSGTFASADVANNIVVTANLSGLSLTGSKALDYDITGVTTGLTADITQAPLTISGLAATNKVYDTTESDTLTGTPTLTGVYVADSSNVVLNGNATSGTFASADVANNIVVTANLSGLSLTGSKALDYNITGVTTGLTADITQAPLTISGLAATNKVYDTTESDTLTGTPTLAGVYASDSSNVVLSGNATSGTFASPDVANNIVVTAGLGGLSLTGSKALDYDITGVTTGLTADITQAPLTISGLAATNKVYDTTESDALTGTPTLTGVYVADSSNVVLNGNAASGTFASADVANNIVVTANLSGLSLTGSKALDYDITGVTTGLTADITQAPLTISGLAATNKVYDTTESDALTGTPTLTGVYVADSSNVVLNGNATSGTFASADVANNIVVTANLAGLSLTGSKALDYDITGVTTGLTADITQAPLTISGLAATNKVYDTTESDTLTGTPTLTGVYVADSSNVVLNGNATSGTFASPDVANNIVVTANLSGLSLTGSKALDYDITGVTTGLTADITQAPLTISGLAATNKVYDTTESDTLTGTPTLAGVYASDSSNVVLSGNATSGTFASPDVANNIVVTASLSGLSLTGSKALDYDITGVTTGLTADITQAPLTISGLAGTNKEYDTTESDTLTGTPTLTGVYVADSSNVVLNGNATSGTFASADVANNIVVTANLSGLSLTGTKALDYDITGVTTGLTADITQAPLTISGLSAQNKIYDTTEAATLTGTATLAGVFTPDLSNVSLLGSATSGTFASADVANNIVVTANLSGLSLTGSKALDYDITGVTTGLTADITQAPLTISGLAATNKVYDTTESDTLSGTPTLTGVYVADSSNVVLNGNATSGTFASPDVANNIVVTANLSGLSLTGSKALDYDITGVTTGLTADITQAPLTISGLAATNKVYDTTESDTLTGTPTLAGVYASDSSNVVLSGNATSGTFASPDVANNIVVTASLSGLSLTGSKALDYDITGVTTGLTADITQAPLTISGLAATNKVYDTTESDTLTGTPTLTGVYVADSSNVVLNGNATSGTFASADVANNIVVTASLSGLSLTGTKALDYDITGVTTGLTADITQAPLTISGLSAQNKIYDTTEAATLTGTATLAGVFTPDLSNVSLLGSATSGTFASADVANNIVVTASLSGLSLTGTKALDYDITGVTTGLTADITQAPLTISGLSAQNKIYDTTEAATLTGTATLAGVFTPDLSNVSLLGSATSGTFASADVANNIVVTANLSGLSLTGTKALDYDITGVTTGLTADITQAPLTISGLAATNKVYDTTESDTLTGTPTLTGVYVADSSNVVLNGNATSGTFVSPDVANNIVVTANLSGLSLTGSKALDYDITGVTTGLTADITQAPLTISGLAATNKVYDTTESDTLTGTPTLAGVYASDSSNVVLSGNATSGTFASPDVANNIVVTANLSGLSLTGSKALDYDITGVTTGLTADITQAPLTISGLAATNKVYDTTESDTLTGTPTLAGVYASDSSNVVLSGNATSGTFASPDVANNIVVTANLSGLSLTGSKALDYDITGVTTGLTADITQAPLTISGLAATNKVYDTTESDTLTGTPTLAGVYASDSSNVVLSGNATSGTFASPDVANNIVVTAGLGGLSLTGSKALDYDITGVTTGLTADITQAPLTISGLAATNKVYDTTESDALTGTPTLTGVYVADSSNVVLNGNATSGTFASADVANNTVVTANLSGLSLTGSKALDYDITGVTTGLTADITQAPLTISGLAATNKVYDTTESDTLTGTPTLTGVYVADSSNVVLNGNATSGTFASADVANNIVVTANLSGLSLTGSKALDYDITGVTTGLTADITQAPLTISGLAATNKVYDTTESDTLTGTPTLTGVYVADSSNVVLNGNATSGTFASADVANNIVVTANLSGLSLTGSKALDYDITGVTTGLTADITQAPLTISGLAATNKVYDTTESDTLTGTPTLTGVYAADSSNVVLNGNATSGTFASADVANNIVVTANLSGLSLTGTKALDYDITGVTTGLTADITQAPLTISGLAATNKVYDTTESDTLTGTPTLTGVYVADSSNVVLNGNATSGTFASADVANNIVVTANLSGLSLTGTKALDYNITGVTTGLTADITQAPLTISGLAATNKVYDTTESDTLTGTPTLTGVYVADSSNVVLNGNAASGTFASADVANNIVVTANLSGLSLTGTKALDYDITGVTTGLTADITQAPLTISGLAATNKVYDTTESDTLTGTPTLAGVYASDSSNVVLSGNATSGTFASPDVANNIVVTAGLGGLSLTGSKALDYDITGVTTGLTADITQAPLTISGLAATNKVYDTTESDTLTGTPTLAGVYASDSSNVVLSGNATSGTFASPDVANNIVVTAGLGGLSLTGSKALDYDITGVTTGLTADITQAPLTISGLAATNKVYDTTESDTLTGTPTLTGVYVADSSNVVLNGNATSGTFASADVANNIVVTANLSGLSLTGTKALDYDITGVTTGLTADITQAPLTISGLSAQNKIYDTTEAATLTGTATLAGVFTPDLSNVSLLGSATSGTFASADVANNIVVTANLAGLSLTGSKALDYDITGVTTGLTADITQAPLTISGLAATNKAYDTTESDTLTGTPTLTGVYVADSSNVVLNGNATSGTFASPDVANNIVVTANLSGLSLTGSKALDYDITGVTTGLTADITQAPLTISGLAATNKVYDTTESDTLTGTPTLAGVYASDSSNVVLSGNATSGTFASPDVANNIVVTASLSGLSLTGSKALDYDITGVTTGLTADITQAPLTISGLAATNKVYDTTESDTLTGTPTLTGVYVADSSNVVLNGNAMSGTFASPDVANNIVVTANLSGLSLTGTKALDYDITGVTTGLTADITQAPLTISGLAATNKVYDTTESDTLTGTPTLAGVYASDSSNVVLSGNATSGTFASPDVANNIVVTAGLGGLSLTGSKALDYDITGVTTGLTADITQAPLTISGLAATNKVYDTTESDTLTGTPTLAGVYASDSSNVLLSGNATSGTFASPDVANNIVVTAGLGGLSLTGTKALDYDITGVTTGLTADITQAPLTISGLAATNKVYDTTESDALTGTPTLTGVYVADSSNVVLNGNATSGTFASPDVANNIVVTASLAGLSLTGSKALDYDITGVTTGLTADITQAPLTISGLAATNKVYDTTESDTLSGTPTLTGVYVADSSNVVLNGNATSGTFASPDVANNIVVTANLSGLSLTGSKALDYDITGVTTGLMADITQAPLTISGLAATNKVYDTTEADTLTGTPTLTGVYASDSSNVVLSGSATSGTFASPDVANNIVVTAGLGGLSLSGSKAGDYDITGVTTGLTADITQAPLTISGLVATNKVYDTTESDTLTGTPTLAGVYASDSSNVVLSGAANSGTFASPDVANNIVVTASLGGLSLTGSKASDYDITGVTTGLTADITQAPLTISGLAATNKVYDSTTADTLTGTPTLAGVLGDDSVVLSGTAHSGTFASPNVANGIAVTAGLSGLSLTGASAANYQITGVTTPLAANITPATLTYSATPATQIYGTVIPTLAGSVSGFVAGQTLATVTTGTMAFTTPATQSSNVGSYAINGSGLAADNGNYVFAQAPGNSTAFTITPATLTYTAGTLSQTYGTAIPTLTGTVTGFVLNQTLASATTGTVSFTTPATQSSNVGHYGITGSGLVADNGDYVFVQAPGNGTALTITPATLTYTANPTTEIAGSSPPALTGTVTGFVLNETQATATTGTLVFTTTANTASAAGNYPIIGSGLTADNGDYVFMQAPANLTALDLQPGAPTTFGPINSATTDLPSFNDFGGIFSSSGGFFGGAGEGSSDGGGSGLSSDLPDDSGEADTSISMGKFAITYEANVQDGREVLPVEFVSLGNASSYTTFDKQDHPSTRVRHRGHEKNEEKNNDDNGHQSQS